MDKSKYKIKIRELAELKTVILTKIFGNEPMPGSGISVTIPDLPFILAQSDIYLVDDTIKKDIYLKAINKSIRVISIDFLEKIAIQRGKAIYFQIQTTVLAQNSLSVRLETKILSQDPAHRIVDLSSLQLQFQKIGNEWLTLEQPTSLSA